MDEDVGDATERSTDTLLRKCQKLAKSLECNLAIGAFALTVGIIITALTFQDSRLREGSTLFLIGPIFIASGIVIMGRSVLFKFLNNYGSSRRRRRHRSGRLEENYIGHSRVESDNRPNTDCSHYNDDPPPYEAAVGSSSANLAISSITLATTVDTISPDIIDRPPPPSYEEAIQHPPVILPEPSTGVDSHAQR